MPIRNRPPLGPYSRLMPTVLQRSQGGVRFLMSEVPLYVMGLDIQGVGFRCGVFRGHDLGLCCESFRVGGTGLRYEAFRIEGEGLRSEAFWVGRGVRCEAFGVPRRVRI